MLAALVAVMLLQRVELPDWRIVLLLAVLALLGEWNSRWISGTAIISLTAIMLAASIALTGPLGAAVVGAFAHALVPVNRARVARAFNTVMAGLLGTLGGVAYLGMGGWVLAVQDTTVADLILHSLLPLFAAMVTVFASNMLFIGGMISLTTGASMWQSLLQTVSSSWVSYLGYAVIGFLFAVLWAPAGLELVSVLVMIAPLLLAQWSLTQRYAEREAHQRTVAALVAAVEARDPVMRGHSARVAATCSLIAEAMHLSPRRVEALQFAAQLHDIGLVGPRPRSFDDDRSMSRFDRERIRQHPMRGVEMLRDIDFLSSAIVAIRHHHERWDGRGYPHGLAGDDIPLLSRIIAVADAYCALTTPRLDRDAQSTSEALAILQERSGDQFDPRCVTAILRVQARLERLTAREDHDDVTVAAGLDHDLPAVSDQLATRREVGA